MLASYSSCCLSKIPTQLANFGLRKGQASHHRELKGLRLVDPTRVALHTINNYAFFVNNAYFIPLGFPAMIDPHGDLEFVKEERYPFVK
jgi:hypothetical protein